MIRSAFSSWREYLTPVSNKSTFRETGEITPSEFVAAGDYLVYKFPTWQWAPAAKGKKRDFLPEDKQVLVTRHVPSYVRAELYLGVDQTDIVDDEVEAGDEEEESWTATGIVPLKGVKNKATEFSHDVQDAGSVKEMSSEEEYDDIDDLIDETAEDDQGEELEFANVNNKKRSYDLYITYSTSYRVPKMYIVGFDSNGTPLTPKQMFEDIVPDYRDKTATIEKAPFLSSTTSVSIHPCKHATVMKVLMNRASIALSRKLQLKADITKGVAKLGLADASDADVKEDDEDAWESVSSLQETQDEPIIRVDQYLIIFLKFISSVTPGIEHDYTMDAF